MGYIVIGILAIATVVFVTYPLFGAQRRLHDTEDAFDLGDSKQLDYLTLKRDRLNENINELDFEHEMGKLSEDDYANIRVGYVSEAEQVAHSLERLRVKKEIEEAIENDVRSRRRIK